MSPRLRNTWKGVTKRRKQHQEVFHGHCGKLPQLRSPRLELCEYCCLQFVLIREDLGLLFQQETLGCSSEQSKHSIACTLQYEVLEIQVLSVAL